MQKTRYNRYTTALHAFKRDVFVLLKNKKGQNSSQQIMEPKNEV